MEAYLRLGIPDGKTEPVGAGVNDASVPSPAGWFPIRFTGQSVEAASSWLLGGGASVGEPHSGDFSFTKNVDFASPALLRAILIGSGFHTAEMVVRHTGAPQGPFYSVMLKNLLVRSISPSSAAGEQQLQAAVENVSLTYAAIEWSYQALDTNGTVFFSSTINWDQVQGKFQTGPLAGVERQDPYAAPDRFVRWFGGGLILPIQILLANDGPDAAFDQLLSSDTALGGNISISGAQVVYTPPAPDQGAEDYFSYRVLNQAGRHSDAVVTIGVRIVTAPTLGLTVSAQSVEVHLTAEAGLRYQLQFTDRLGEPWTDTGLPVSADSNGQVSWTNALQVGTQYYRALILP
jgi:type VI secretion system Hcp family effector